MYVRKIMDEFYKNSPDGLIGNEDCGQMSAWYVLSASGFYPVTPGSPVYMVGTPLFPEITYHLESGKTFTVRATNVSAKNIYILNAKLNGAPLRKASITHSDVMNGGVLEFVMTDAPVVTAFDELPKFGTSISTVAVPRIERGPGGRIFIGTSTAGAEIYYTADGSDPRTSSTHYVAPFRLSDDTPAKIIKAIAVNSTGEQSLIAEAQFHKKPNNWTVKIFSTYNRQYTGGGDEGLIDGIRGTTNFASGEWQGYQGQDFVAVIDLQKPTPISKVGGSFLQAARSWIWMPTHVEFEISNDGENFTKIAEIKTDVTPENMEQVIREYSQTVNPVTARYVRVNAHNLGKIPAWHPGAGSEAFIFVDEIIIQ